MFVTEISKQKKNDGYIGVRVPQSVRRKIQQIAENNSSEEVKVTESDVIREILINALPDDRAEANEHAG